MKLLYKVTKVSLVTLADDPTGTVVPLCEAVVYADSKYIGTVKLELVENQEISKLAKSLVFLIDSELNNDQKSQPIESESGPVISSL